MLGKSLLWTGSNLLRRGRMGINRISRMGRNPTSDMTRRPLPNIVQRMTPRMDNSISKLNTTLPHVHTPARSVSDMDDGSFQTSTPVCNNISSESSLHYSSKPQDTVIVDLSSDEDTEDVSLSHEGLARLPPCINIVRLDEQV